jgi:ABC-type uncharacterized transport system involved in gliding motility auxiliary subunit
MKRSTKFIAVVLLFVALVLVNYLAAKLPLRLDATADKIYTLSPGTRAILARIEEPVRLDFYWSRSASSPPADYKNFAARVEEMLRQYVRAARGKISLRVIDPSPDTPEEEQAMAAGVRPQIWPGGEEKIYLGLAATQADQQKSISSFDPEREPLLEYDLSQLIDSVQQFDKKKLGLITSLPLMGLAMSGPQAVITEWRKTFDVVPLDESVSEVPPSLDALAVIHPSKLSPQLQYSIDQFLLAGKPVFLALGPCSEYFKQMAGRMNLGRLPPDVSSDLPVLLKAYGIDYDSNTVVGDLENAASVRDPNTEAVVRYPVWLLLGRKSFNPAASPTAQLESMALIDPGSFKVKLDPAVSTTPLIESSTQCGSVPAMALYFSRPDDIMRLVKADGRQRLLAALITGKLKTAFPHGAPGATGKTSVPALAQSKGSSTLIFIADTDWLLDDFSVQRMNYLGLTAIRPLNDNLAFAANALDFLAGSPDLISIRGKGTSLRPFVVVKDMQVEAQKRYQKQLDALEAHLGEVQQKLSALQAQKAEGKSLIIPPEVEKSIEAFRQQQADMQRQRREIRLSLRQGIDALGNFLLLVNLLSTPLLVCAFGVWFARVRRK